MTPGQLVRAMSVALDVPEETVVQHDRNLVMAGLRTKGGRGRSAPEVTPLDAARLLVATLASFRTKDSVATVKQFERAVFEPPDRPRTISFRGFKLHDGGASDASTFLDRAIASLPPTHNFIEALAALIADASRPVEDFEAFLKRFARIGVTCSSPSGRATIGGTRFVRYLIPIVVPANETPESWEERQYFLSGIHQDRKAYGSAVMLLGAAFRENGPSYATAYEAYLAGYGTKNQKPRSPKSAKQGGV